MPDTLQWPLHTVQSDTFPLVAGRIDYMDPKRLIHAVIDTQECDFSVAIHPEAPSAYVAEFLDQALHPMGLELLSEDECAPETNEDGWTVIYAVPVMPVMPVGGVQPCVERALSLVPDLEDDAPAEDEDELDEPASYRNMAVATVGSMALAYPVLNWAVPAVLGVIGG